MKHTTLTIAFLLGLLLAFPPEGQGQKPTVPPDRQRAETGLPFVTWFSPQDYRGTPQIWSFAQDDRGILYAGSGNGVLEYDGTSWRTIATPHSAIVRALDKGSDGRIFVGETGDFGYLQPDKTGAMKFVSLLEFVPQADRAFQDVQAVQTTPEGVYFLARERLFRLTPDGQGWRVKSWKPATGFIRAFYMFGKLYVTAIGEGLQQLAGDTLKPLPLPELKEQTGDSAIRVMLPHEEAGAQNAQQSLLGLRSGQLFLLDDSGSRPVLTPFVTEAAPLLLKQKLYRGAILSDGALGLGTLTGGFLILEHNGKTRRYLDRVAVLPSDGVLGVFIDRVGTLWLGLQNGIAKVEVASPLTEFGAVAGMSAFINDLVRYRGDLYAATTSGIGRLDSATGMFRPVPGSESQATFGLLVHGDRLLASGSRDGILQITGNTATPFLHNEAIDAGSYAMAHARQNANRIWLATGEGLASFRWDVAGRWVDEGLVAKMPIVRSIVEPEPGLLWLGTESQGVVRVRLQGDSLLNPEVKRFGKADGLPTDGGVSVHGAAGRVIFASRNGVREFDAATGRFVESKLFGAVPTGGSPEEYTLATAPDGSLWVNFGVRPVLLQRQSDGSFKMNERILQRIGDGRVIWLHTDEDGVLWLGGQDRVYRYDPAQVRNSNEGFPVLVRRVTAGEQAKTLLYAGGGGNAAAQGVSPVAYGENSLRFEYAAASLEDPTRNQFQTMLEGFDRDWSAWTLETRRDYTNLPPGSYRFRVKALNALGQAGTEAEYRLTILPPWYRTWWAYCAYALALAGLGYAVTRLIRRRVVAREREKSALREAQLRAETAAAQAKTLQAENERNKNVELLSEIGKDLTSSLDLDTIFLRLYEHVNQLVDATIFGVGLYHPERHEIDYRLAMESGKRYAPYTRDTHDRNQFPVWCLEHRQPVFINDVATEYSKYLTHYEEPRRNLEGGGISTAPASMMYLPLMMKDRVLGVITVQSFKPNAYTNYHLDLLENLAAYTSIALDNADAYHHLKATQDQLVVQEKLASLGALTAGIAHEIKNPLNFVNNFADLSVELMDELREDINKHKAAIPEKDFENIEDLLDDLTGNAKKINEHGKRADGIVRSMLLHSRGQAGERQATDINAMLDEYVNLTYHGMRAQDSSFNVTIERALASDAGTVEAIPQDLSRVFLNLLNNACYAVNDKAKKNGAGFVPKLRVSTVNLGDAVEIRIRDNGMGIPPEVREKIFNPFFTTKPTGQGTGLGLSISHDIVVQQHNGQLEVETEPGEFTEFIVRLPRNGRNAQ
ncbi:MAG: GAF domain-containing protein [Acidobacteria bacterium]|nr:GAF domain-containing protein [Acidobacteriota bacterium]MBI3422978.1 GAF domain-containing protein [Acidobacteriota bacterium]